MDVRDLVVDHYSGRGYTERLLGALRDAGVDVDAMTVEDLSPVDQLHAGMAPATSYVLSHLAPGPQTRLLDVGCGIGGGSRMAAAAGAGAVTGVDLTPDFVETAKDLTGRVGLADRVGFVLSGGEKLPFEDGAFNAAMMIHVGMNVPFKAALFREVRRVLAVGAPFVVYDQMRTGDGALLYPMPWADTEQSSFVQSPEEYAEALVASGFEITETIDRTGAVAGPPPGRSNVDPGTLFGPAFRERIGNNIAATQAGKLGAVVIVARAVPA